MQKHQKNATKKQHVLVRPPTGQLPSKAVKIYNLNIHKIFSISFNLYSHTSFFACLVQVPKINPLYTGLLQASLWQLVIAAVLLTAYKSFSSIISKLFTVSKSLRSSGTWGWAFSNSQDPFITGVAAVPPVGDGAAGSSVPPAGKLVPALGVPSSSSVPPAGKLVPALRQMLHLHTVVHWHGRNWCSLLAAGHHRHASSRQADSLQFLSTGNLNRKWLQHEYLHVDHEV